MHCALLLLAAVALLGFAGTASAQNVTEPPYNVTCVLESETKVVCEGKAFHEAEGPLSPKGALFWIYLLISIFLVVMGGMMSGLTVGLLSLDPLRMDIAAKSGSPTDRKYAARIVPLLKRRHLLLVVLLLTNAACMEALPLFLDKLVPEFAAILISVTAVLAFGEIIPQALCVRFSLAIGGNMFWLPWLLIILEFPIAWPISKLLDCLLGTHTIEYYKHAELKELVTRHGEKAAGSQKLSIDETTIIGGALEMRNKTVAQVMTPVAKVFMLDVNGKLDARTMQMIVQNGHSRIPVYSKDPDHMQGLILVKELLGVVANENRPIQSILLHPMPSVAATTILMDMLNEFQLGHSHLASVFEEQADGTHRTVGVITLEDVLEELLQEEILDEHDHLRAHKLKQPPPLLSGSSAAGVSVSRLQPAPAAVSPAAPGANVPASPMPMKMKGVFKNVPAERKLSAPISPPPQVLQPSAAAAPAAVPAPGVVLVPITNNPPSAAQEPIEKDKVEKEKKKDKKKHKKDKKAAEGADLV